MVYIDFMTARVKLMVLLLLSMPLLMKGKDGGGLDSISVVAKGAKLKEISKQFSFTEGPAVNKKGDVYFTDQPNNKIWKYTADGELSVFMENAGRSNGTYFDSKGNLITCADEKNELWSISPKGEVTVLLSNYQGRRFNGPNDLWIDGKGGIYFTDPYYQRKWWEHTEPEITDMNVYYLPKGAKEAVVVDDNIIRPNGLIGTPDGKHLYVADIEDNKTYKYDINQDGSLTNRQLFANLGSDGMTIDNHGNVYLTGKGVTIFDSKGIKIANIPVPAPWTANICFGGKDRDMLFITASEGIYTLQMQVKGVN